MKLVAIARVKNEIDIVEAFVRHHARHFDKLIVLDDGSSDGTYQVLQRLQSICCDLVLLRQPAIGYLQHRYMSLLLRMAVDKFGADWVLPLDADEFVEPNDRLMLAQVLAGREPAVYRLQWSNFVWTPEIERSDEQNPVLRQRLRLPPSVGFSKLLIHAEFVNATVELSLGNHVLTYNGLPLAAEPFEGMTLCHYPVRSIAQYAGKIAVGYLQYVATPDWRRDTGFHYIEPFRELAEFGLDGFTRRMMRDFSILFSRRGAKIGRRSAALRSAAQLSRRAIDPRPSKSLAAAECASVHGDNGDRIRRQRQAVRAFGSCNE